MRVVSLPDRACDRQHRASQGVGISRADSMQSSSALLALSAFRAVARELQCTQREIQMRLMMSLILAVAVSVPIESVAENIPVAAPSGTEEQGVLPVEDEYVAAEVSRNEQEFRRIVDEEFMHNSSDGSTSGKEMLIQEVLQLRMLGQSLRERSVLTLETSLWSSALPTYDSRMKPRGSKSYRCVTQRLT